MDRATKLFIAGWACAAIAVQLWLVPSLWPGFKTHTIVVFVIAAALSAINRRSISLVLILAYVYPVVIFMLGGRYHIDYDILWMAALAGAIVPDALQTGWHVPSRWRAPLVLWALIIAIGTTIVFAREMDFYPPLLREPRIGNSVTGGGGPAFVSLWLFHVSLTFILGILWFDWLFGAGLDFRRDVATPLMISCLALAAVSVYQLFVDFTFLNYNVFGGTGRASGTMFDANVSGAIAAFWTGGAILWAFHLRRWRTPIMIAVFVAAWLAVWASGSRTAFAAAAVATLFSVFAFREAFRRLATRGRPAHLAAAAAVAVSLVWLLAHANPQIIGPITRLRDTLPQPSIASVREFAWRMWDRDRYGTVAVTMIREFPAFGVGLGGYHLMLNDSIEGPPLIPDNAQNWYRHQIVEVGIVGSLGWIAWLVGFGWFVLMPQPKAPAVALVARGVLIGFALISLVGMPSQALAVSFTFWTMAFWYVSLVGSPPAAPLSRRAWGALAVVAVTFALGTGYLAATSLRVPARAQRAGFPFTYGLYYPEPDGSGGEYRWTRQRSCAVIDTPKRVMEISVSVNHRDIATRPVDVQVWTDGTSAIKTTLRDTKPVTKYVHLPAGEVRVIIDTWVSRVVHPVDLGVPDVRELGLMVRWSFIDRVPDGATAIELQ